MSDGLPHISQSRRRSSAQQCSDVDDEVLETISISAGLLRASKGPVLYTTTSASGTVYQHSLLSNKEELYQEPQGCQETNTTTPRPMTLPSPPLTTFLPKTTGGIIAPRESMVPAQYYDRFPVKVESSTTHCHLSQEVDSLCLASRKMLGLNIKSTPRTIDHPLSGHPVCQDSLEMKAKSLNRDMQGVGDGSRDSGGPCASIGGLGDVIGCNERFHVSTSPGPSLEMRRLGRLSEEICLPLPIDVDQSQARMNSLLHNRPYHERVGKQIHTAMMPSSQPVITSSLVLASSKQPATSEKRWKTGTTTEWYKLERTQLPVSLNKRSDIAVMPPYILPSSKVTSRSRLCRDRSPPAKTPSFPADSSRPIQSMYNKQSWSQSVDGMCPVQLLPSSEIRAHQGSMKNTILTLPDFTATPTHPVCLTRHAIPTPLACPRQHISPRKLEAEPSVDRPSRLLAPTSPCAQTTCSEHRPRRAYDMPAGCRLRSPRGNGIVAPVELNYTNRLQSNMDAVTIMVDVNKYRHRLISLEKGEAGLVTPSHDELALSSPHSSDSHTHYGTSDDEGYDTPMTSPEPSPPRRLPSSTIRFANDARLTIFDGAHDASHPQAPIEPSNSVTDNELEAGSEVLTDRLVIEPDATSSDTNGIGNLALDITVGSVAGGSMTADHSPVDDTTPLAAACPAKGAQAYPFPRQLDSLPSRQSVRVRRRPSALLQHCGGNSIIQPRRPRFSLPDRFVPPRANTPNKEIFMIRQSVHKANSTTQTRQMADEADPFMPSPRRRRVDDRLITVRLSATPPSPDPRNRTTLTDPHAPRSFSEGAVWSVGGRIVTEGVASTPNGRGGRVTSSTCAPHHTADFLRKPTTSEEEATHGRRLALAMDINQKMRMIEHGVPTSTDSMFPDTRCPSAPPRRTIWRYGAWERDSPEYPSNAAVLKPKEVPIIPFRVLDAPALRDDYYCSLLAYSPTIHCLAVGLGSHVYLWSEARGSRPSNIPDSLNTPYDSHVTSLSFSSQDGASSILAIGRADGKITLWSPVDHDPRFDSEQPAPISCVSFRPHSVPRKSTREPGMTTATEDLLVGDEIGDVYYYSVEWPSQNQRDLFDWHGSMTLLARISCHTQQICGLAWSPSGDVFATGGNDNQMFLFESKKLLSPASIEARRQRDRILTVHSVQPTSTDGSSAIGQEQVLNILLGQQRHIFTLNAAVKAIAFAPWQKSLVAAGGGSNDRCIHFFHATSGATLATIDCHAQVTSLLWSERRKEIAATFGFAQPEHPYRVAVFSWPSCRMVVGIPWWSEERALYAVSYPRGPSGGMPNPVDAEGRP